jgi:hypothetical protein
MSPAVEQKFVANLLIIIQKISKKIAIRTTIKAVLNNK